MVVKESREEKEERKRNIEELIKSREKELERERGMDKMKRKTGGAS